jgi:hypothetical protein
MAMARMMQPKMLIVRRWTNQYLGIDAKGWWKMVEVSGRWTMQEVIDNEHIIITGVIRKVNYYRSHLFP